LSKEGKSLWMDIVSSKAPDFFDAGSFPLLAMFVQAITMARALDAQLSALPSTPEGNRQAARLERRWHKAVTVACMLGVKCRLTVQAAVDRRSRMLDEKWAANDRLFKGRDS
jgi:hypothetical protein